jgi:hypothetical protein
MAEWHERMGTLAVPLTVHHYQTVDGTTSTIELLPLNRDDSDGIMREEWRQHRFNHSYSIQ